MDGFEVSETSGFATVQCHPLRPHWKRHAFVSCCIFALPLYFVVILLVPKAL